MAGLLLSGVACTKEPPKALVIPFPLPLTGSHASFGEIQKNAVLIAVEDANKAGGVLGRQIEVKFYDQQSNTDVAASVMEQLITVEKHTFVVGEYASSTGRAAAGVAARNNIPFLVVTPSTTEITNQGWKTVFRYKPTAAMYAAGLQDFFLKVVKPQTMAIIHERTDFGVSAAKQMDEWCKRNNIQVVRMDAYEEGTADFRPMLSQVKAANPDVLYMVSYVMDAILLQRQIEELKIAPKVIAGGAAGHALPQFIKDVGKGSEAVMVATLWSGDAAWKGKWRTAKSLWDEYVKRYGKDPTYHAAEAYSSIEVIVDAIARAKSTKSEDIVKALKATNLQTVYGMASFPDWKDPDTGKDFTNQGKMDTLVLQVVGGKHVPVWPPNAAVKDPVYPFPSWDQPR